MLWGLFECRCSRRPEREFKVCSRVTTLSGPARASRSIMELTHKHQSVTEHEKRCASSENATAEWNRRFSRVNPSLRLQDRSALPWAYVSMEVTYQSEKEMKVCVSLGCEYDNVEDLLPHDA